MAAVPSKVPWDDLRYLFGPPSHAHRNLTSLAPQERLPEILVVPREKTPTGAPLRGLQAIGVATREESGVLGFPSRRGLTLLYAKSDTSQ